MIRACAHQTYPSMQFVPGQEEWALGPACHLKAEGSVQPRCLTAIRWLHSERLPSAVDSQVYGSHESLVERREKYSKRDPELFHSLALACGMNILTIFSQQGIFLARASCLSRCVTSFHCSGWTQILTRSAPSRMLGPCLESAPRQSCSTFGPLVT